MTGSYSEFIDVTGGDASRAPLVRGQLRAYYLTGSGGVPETPAQISAAQNAGMTVLGIDQTPGLRLFGQGKAQIADVEYLAGTDASAASMIRERESLGVRLHTLYVSYSALGALRDAVAGLAGVMYGVADYGWSLAEAERLLAANPGWAYCQFGDPASNPGTLIPGTGVSLRQANADINVAGGIWAANFAHGAAAPSPSLAPVPPARRNIYTPVAVDGDYGPASTRAEQFVSSGGDLGQCDGIFGPESKQSMQAHLGVTRDSVIGPVTVKALQQRVGAEPADGRWGAETTAKLQDALNRSAY